MQKIFQKICNNLKNVGIFAEKCRFFGKKLLLKEHKSQFALIFALDFNSLTSRKRPF